MTPIAFDDISCLSDENLPIEERTRIADKVRNEHGVEGLLTLWACQDFYDPIEPMFKGFTPATAWWLTENNHHADLVRDKLSLLNETDALALLKMATFPPEVDFNIWAFADTAGTPAMFAPEQSNKFSHANALTVMQLAERFFPQYPQFVQPMCSLYMDVIDCDDQNEDSTSLYPAHTGTLEAFADDAAALQYLVRSHTGISVDRCYATPAMTALLLATDGEWAMYENMGVSLEDAYVISKNPGRSALELALPQHFDDRHETELSI